MHPGVGRLGRDHGRRPRCAGSPPSRPHLSRPSVENTETTRRSPTRAGSSETSRRIPAGLCAPSQISSGVLPRSSSRPGDDHRGHRPRHRPAGPAPPRPRPGRRPGSDPGSCPRRDHARLRPPGAPTTRPHPRSGSRRGAPRRASRRRSPRGCRRAAAVCSRSMLVSTTTRLRASTLVASSRPPRPASTTAHSTPACGERHQGGGGQRLELGDALVGHVAHREHRAPRRRRARSHRPRCGSARGRSRCAATGTRRCARPRPRAGPRRTGWSTSCRWCRRRGSRRTAPRGGRAVRAARASARARTACRTARATRCSLSGGQGRQGGTRLSAASAA